MTCGSGSKLVSGCGAVAARLIMARGPEDERACAPIVPVTGAVEALGGFEISGGTKEPHVSDVLGGLGRPVGTVVSIAFGTIPDPGRLLSPKKLLRLDHCDDDSEGFARFLAFDDLTALEELEPILSLHPSRAGICAGCADRALPC